jgi:cytochrome c
MMLRLKISALFLPVLALFSCGRAPSPEVVREERTLLVVTDPEAPPGAGGQALLDLLPDLSRKAGFRYVQADTYDWLEEDSLRQFSALLLIDVREDSLRLWQRTSIERYVQAGNGLILLDTSAVVPYSWHWHARAMADTLAVDPKGPAGTFYRSHAFDGGRLVRLDTIFPASPGDKILDELADAVNYAIGDNKYDYSRVSSLPAPRWDQFTVTVLDDDIYEPMEMVVLPFGDVLFLERRGKIKLYDAARKKTEVIAEFDVCIEGNYEDGLHGLALDPDFRENNFLYLYYSPPCDTPYQFLSRFVFKNNKLDLDSEIVMLRVFVQRETCCHSGGSVEFGPDGLLYLSTGDNTSSKESEGYSPVDERPGRGPFDAQKSSSNTNDLRGKIIRIRPEPDGTYSIPDDNLFPKDGSGGRPEIYTMGCRNPFRIAIDKRTNILYWGDVGPDSGEDSRYGPRSYDEWNQAAEAGNYGWPYFQADNKAFPSRDFATDEVGPPQDPQRPINRSPNNTGAEELPPAKPAMFWYPYQHSKEFPMLGVGSRSAMAGPFYYTDDLMPLSAVLFPDYYVGKWFIFEWARSWIKVVTFDENNRPVQIEPFLPDLPISKPIELEFGPNGALYVLEYGNQYFMNNPDARLIRIDFTRGNRPPVARLQADRKAGATPLEVPFSAAASFDYDLKDSLRFEWQMIPGAGFEQGGAEMTFIFREPGVYHPTVRVTDSQGASATASVQVEAGNEPPVVSVRSAKNQSFFFDTGEWPYEITIFDEEDARAGQLDPGLAFASFAYVDDPQYLHNLLTGKAVLPEGPIGELEGARMIRNSDCYTCHHETETNIGPSYQAVAERYKGDYQAVARLAERVIKGGNKVWGEAMMSAHPQLKPEESEQMVRYILSLGSAQKLPLKGSIPLRAHDGSETPGGYVLSASYRDKGTRQAGPQTTRLIHIIRPPKAEAETAGIIANGFIPQGGLWGAFEQINLRDSSFFAFRQIDLKGVNRLRIRLMQRRGGTLEVRLDGPEGLLAGNARLDSEPQHQWTEISLSIRPSSSIHDLYFCLKSNEPDVKRKEKPGEEAFIVDWIWFGK